MREFIPDLSQFRYFGVGPNPRLSEHEVLQGAFAGTGCGYGWGSGDGNGMMGHRVPVTFEVPCD